MRKLLVLVTVLAAAGCGPNEVPMPEETPESSAGEFQYTETTLKAEKEAQKRIALVTVNEAVQGYRALDDAKRYPSSLDDLVEGGMLSSLPELPEGHVFTYNAETGEVAIEEGVTVPETPAVEEPEPVTTEG